MKFIACTTAACSGEVKRSGRRQKGGAYLPTALRGPYALLIGLLTAQRMSPPLYSLTEDQLKSRSQPYTSSDLLDSGDARVETAFNGSVEKLLKELLMQKEGDGSTAKYSLLTTGRQVALIAEQFHSAYCNIIRTTFGFTFPLNAAEGLPLHILPSSTSSSSSSVHRSELVCCICLTGEKTVSPS